MSRMTQIAACGLLFPMLALAAETPGDGKKDGEAPTLLETLTGKKKAAAAEDPAKTAAGAVEAQLAELAKLTGNAPVIHTRTGEIVPVERKVAYETRVELAGPGGRKLAFTLQAGPDGKWYNLGKDQLELLATVIADSQGGAGGGGGGRTAISPGNPGVRVVDLIAPPPPESPTREEAPPGGDIGVMPNAPRMPGSTPVVPVEGQPEPREMVPPSKPPVLPPGGNTVPPAGTPPANKPGGPLPSTNKEVPVLTPP